MDLILTILLYSPVNASVEQVLISAFCALCGARRGRPDLVRRYTDSGSFDHHEWVNSCGHVDTIESLWREIDLQCADPGCVVLFSHDHYPFCTQQCAYGNVAALMADLERIGCRIGVCADLLEDAAAAAKLCVDEALGVLGSRVSGLVESGRE